MTWNELMTYAHNGIDLKPIPDVDDPFEKPPASDAVATAQPGEAGATAASRRAVDLSAATTERLIAIEELMRKASRLKPLAALAPPADGDRRSGGRRDGRYCANRRWHASVRAASRPRSAVAAMMRRSSIGGFRCAFSSISPSPWCSP